MRENDQAPIWLSSSTRETQRFQRVLSELADSVVQGPVGVDVVHIPTWSRCVECMGEPLLAATYQPGELESAEGKPTGSDSPRSQGGRT